MSYIPKKILILDAYCRQTLPIIRGFKRISCDVTVVCCSKLDVGYASKYSNHKILLNCSRDDYSFQEKEVCKLIETGNYDLVVPLNDYSAIYLSKNKKHLSSFAKIAVNDSEIFNLAINKLNTMRVCTEEGIPCPITFFTDDFSQIINCSEIKYPLVVKPKTACGSIGFNIVYDSTHLEHVLNNIQYKKLPAFVQEYIPQNGDQFGVEAFRNSDGSYSFILIDKKPRWFPIDGGSPTINISVHNEEIKNYAIQLLNAMNWVGYANIDFVMDSRDNTPKILEVNGRISAAVSLDEFAGYNVSKLIYDNAFSDSFSICDDYVDGLKVSCILTELLWFVKSKTRFSNKPTMFSRKNTRDVIFSKSDIKPFLTFCIQSAQNYKHAMMQRKRT